MTKSKGVRDKQVTSKEKFISRCDEIFGEGALDYSKVEYVDTATRVTLTCNRHGVEYQSTPNTILSGKTTACPECKREKLRSKMKVSEDFLRKVIDEKMLEGYKIHDLTYNNSSDYVELECPIHGVFKKQVVMIPRVNNVCAKCSRDEKKIRDAEKIWHKYLGRMQEQHPTLDFSKFVYVDRNTPSTVICPVHGEFDKAVANMLQCKTACSQCYNEGKCVDGESFAVKAKSVHGDLYDYSKAKLQYVNQHDQVEIYCKHCKEYFKQQPNNHLMGKGCRKCAGRNTAQMMHWNNPTSLSKKPNLMYRPTYLYIFMLENYKSVMKGLIPESEEVIIFKVGITYEESLCKRMQTIIRESKYQICPLYLFKSTRIDCLDFEHAFHKSNKSVSHVETGEYGGKHEVYQGTQEVYDKLSDLVEKLRSAGTFEEVDMQEFLNEDFEAFMRAYEERYIV